MYLARCTNRHGHHSPKVSTGLQECPRSALVWSKRRNIHVVQNNNSIACRNCGNDGFRLIFPPKLPAQYTHFALECFGGIEAGILAPLSADDLYAYGQAVVEARGRSDGR